MILTLILILLNQVPSEQQFQTISCLAIQRAILSIGASFNQTVTLTRAWTQPQPSIHKLALAIEGWQKVSAHPFSYNAFINSYDSSQLVIYVEPNGPSFAWISFSILVARSSSVGIMELNTVEYFNQFLNMSGRVAGQDSQDYYYYPQLQMDPVQDFKVGVYIVGCNVTNSLTYSTHIEVEDSYILNSTTVQIIHRSWHYHQNAFFSITYTILLVNTARLSSAFVLKQYTSSQSSIATTNYQRNFTYSEGWVPEFDMSLCFAGHQSITTFPANDPPNSLTLSYSLNQISIDIHKMAYFGYQLFCLVECNSSYELFQTASIYQCYQCSAPPDGYTLSTKAYPGDCFDKCSDLMVDCYKCNSTSVCEVCYHSQLVTGLCTNVSGCTRTGQLHSSSITYCLECDPVEFVIDFASQTCVCFNSSYFMVTYHCTNVIGCLSTEHNGTHVNCLVCNKSADMTLAGDNTCVCQNGFEVTQDGQCHQICGDGKNMYEYQCDDGNTINGDGCSSECIVQSLYDCPTVGLFGQSKCYYLRPLELVKDRILSTANINQARIRLRVVPVLSLNNNLSFGGLLSLSINSENLPISDWSYNGGLLDLTFPYGQSIEGQTDNISFIMDSNYIRYKQMVTYLSFQADSQEVTLDYIADEGQYNLLQQIFFWVNVCIAVLFTVSLLVHPIMAAELIVPFQLIFLMHFMTDNYTRFISTLQYFTYTMVNPYYFVNQRSSIITATVFNRLEFHTNNHTISLTIVTCLVLVPSLLWLIVRIFSKNNNKSRKKSKNKQGFEKLAVSISVSSNISFAIPLIIMACDLPRLKESVNYSGQLTISDLTIPSLAINSAIFFIIILDGQSFIAKSALFRPKNALQYVKILYFYCLLCALIANIYIFQMNFRQILGCYCILAFSLFVLIRQIMLPPYRNFIQNCGIFFNISMVLLVGLMMISRDLRPQWSSDQNQALMLFVVYGFMISSLVFTLLRILHTLAFDMDNSRDSQNKRQQQILEEDRLWHQRHMLSEYKHSRLINHSSISKDGLNPLHVVMKRQQQQQNLMRPTTSQNPFENSSKLSKASNLSVANMVQTKKIIMTTQQQQLK